MIMDICRNIRVPLARGIFIGALAPFLFSMPAGAQDAADDPGYGKRNPNIMTLMMPPADKDGMFYMLNLMKYRPKAIYKDGRETDLTGEEADNTYDPLPEVAKVGGGIVYAAEVKEQLAGDGVEWDRVGIVMYPARRKLIEMSTSPDFQKTVVHKEAGMEMSQVIVTLPEPWTLSDKAPLAAKDIPYPTTSSDGPVSLIHLVKYRDVAEYPAGRNEPKRTGREAMAIFDESVEPLLYDMGATPLLKAQVDFVLVGDGREWSEYRILRFPSSRAMEEVQRVIGESDFAQHHTAAVEDEYTMTMSDLVDFTANPPKPGAGAKNSGGANQATMIFSALDRNKDGKISKDEAIDEMKANFNMIDSNKDGGIDVDELSRVLNMQP